MAIIEDTDLLDIMRSDNQLFLESASFLYERKKEKLDKSFEDASSTFKSYAKNLETSSLKIFEADSRQKTKLAQRQLKLIENDIKSNDDLAPDEKEALSKMHLELMNVNKSLIKNEHSMKSAFGNSLKENLPSIAGILGSIGMDNPAFLFLGSMMTSMMDKRRDALKEDRATRSEFHKEKIKNDISLSEKTQEKEKKTTTNSKTTDTTKTKTSKTTEKKIDITKVIESKQEKDNNIYNELQAQTDVLSYTSNLISAMVKFSQSQAFAEIEAQREAVRRQNSLIDSVNDLGENLEENGPLKEEKEGFLSKLMDGFGIGSIMAGMTAVTGVITAIGAGLAGFATLLAPIAIGVASAYVIYEGFKGAFSGWDKAAEKLGKDSATLTDKMASAYGGWLGGITGIADSILGMFGLETQIGPWVDQKTTEILANAFNWIKGIGDSAEGLFTSISNYVDQKMIDLSNLVINSIDFFKDTFTNGIKKITSFEMPDMGVLINEGTEKIMDGVNNMMDDIAGIFDSFSFKSLFGFGDDSEKKETTKEKESKGFLGWFRKKEELVSTKQELPEVPQVKKQKEVLDKNGIKKEIPVSEIITSEKNSSVLANKIVEKQETLKEKKETITHVQNKSFFSFIFGSNKKEKEFKELKELAKVIEIKVPRKQSTAEFREKAAEIINQDGVMKERSSFDKTVSVVNAPSSTRVNNNSSTTNVHQTQLSPHDHDRTFSFLNAAMGV